MISREKTRFSILYGRARYHLGLGSAGLTEGYLTVEHVYGPSV